MLSSAVNYPAPAVGSVNTAVRSLVRAITYVLVPLALAIALALNGYMEVAVLVLTVPVLLVAVVTLVAVTPGRAELVVQRQEELNLTDLIFFGSADNEIPRDFLLQLNVAVANVGGRKAVLSRLDLEELRDGDGHVVKPLDMPFPQGAQIFRQTMTYRIEHGLLDRVINNEIGAPPLTLEPDDVVTLRFRSRRGIDWTLPRWDLQQIRTLVESLERPVTMARIKATYRRGARIVTSHHDVSVETTKQTEYVTRLRTLTNDLTVRPAIAPQPFDLE
jgi:hypothetical protein